MKKRSGISPVISSVIILAISVTMGLALWSYTKSNVNTATQSFANTVTSYVNYLSDNFVPVNAAFAYDTTTWHACGGSAGNCATIWVYNYGSKPVLVSSVTVMKTNNAATLRIFNVAGNSAATIAGQSMGNVTVSYGSASQFLHNGTSYTFQVITNNGLIQNYFQVDK